MTRLIKSAKMFQLEAAICSPNNVIHLVANSKGHLHMTNACDVTPQLNYKPVKLKQFYPCTVLPSNYSYTRTFATRLPKSTKLLNSFKVNLRTSIK